MRISDWSSDVCSSDLQITADNHPHHLVRAFKDAVDAKVAVDALDRIIHQIAIAAVKLERAIGDPHRLVGRKALCHGGEMRLVRRALCPLDGSGITEGARSQEPRFHFGQGEPGPLDIPAALAESGKAWWRARVCP